MEEKEILSQEEIDALLKGIEAGKVPIAPEKPAEEVTGTKERKVEKFSFSAARRMVSKMKFPAFEVIHQRFASNSRTTLSAALQRVMDLTVTSVDIMEFHWFLDNVPVPAAYSLISLKPLRGLLIIVFEAKLVYSIVDLLLGGFGRTPPKIEGREFTKIEQRLLRKVVELMIKDYERSWHPIFKVTSELVRMETHPQFVSIVPPNDLIAVVNLEMDLGESVGKVWIGMPYAMIEPIRGQLQAAYQPMRLEVDSEWISRLLERLEEVPVEVTAEIGRAKIKGEEVLALKVGDVIKLNTSADEDSTCIYIQGVPKFKALPGKLGEMKGVQITGKLESKEDIRKVVWRRYI